MSVDTLIHVANVLFLASYSVRDILWLRVLTVVAIASLLPYYYANGLMPPIYWNLLFLAINGAQIVRLILERRPVQLADEQHRLYRLAFRSLRPREFVRLLASARWTDVGPGDIVVREGETVDQMLVVVDGALTIEHEGSAVAELGAGRFVGEMSYLTGKAAGANVVARRPTRYVAWEQGELHEFLERNLDLRAALQGILGADLASKLRAATG